MPGAKQQVLEIIGKEVPGMSETSKTYLMGFLEGFAAMANDNATAQPQPEPDPPGA